MAGAAPGAKPGDGSPVTPVELDPEGQMTDRANLGTNPAENPDNLEEPTEIDAPALFYPPPPSKTGLSTPAIRSTVGSDESGNIEPWGTPGSLKLNKTAAPVEGTANRWLITLTLEGKDIAVETTSDIVLVVDTSGSMKGKRITAARNAAREFVNTLLKEGDSATRIAVISFASGVTVHNNQSNQPFRNAAGKGDLLSAINTLGADGGTFTQAGLRQARLLLNSSTADNRNIVLLSDGEPTYSYEIKNIKGNLNENYFTKAASTLLGSTWHTKDSLSEPVYDYNKTAGGGNSITTRISGIFTTYHYHHGNSAVAESNYIKDMGITIYSVGLDAGDDGQDILDRIASPGRSYTATENDLEAIFQDIAGSITRIAAARNAVVTDPMGEKFSIPGIDGSNYQSKITVDWGTVAYDPATETIEWSIPYISESRSATMSCTVQIDDDAASGVLYPTNKPTFVDYINIDDEPAKKHFTIPRVGIVAAGTIVLTKKVQNGDDCGKRFPIYVVRAEDGRTWSALLRDGESAAIIGLGVGTYSVSEVVPMGYRKVGINPSVVIFTAENSTAEFESKVTNRKVKHPWFWDEDEKVNTFTVKAAF